MEKRTFDEMISYFNREVADMDIPRKNKMKLLGIVTSIGLQHSKDLLGMIVRSALTYCTWIPTKKAMPDPDEYVLVTTKWDEVLIGRRYGNNAWYIMGGCEDSYTDEHIKAWARLPEPYNGEEKSNAEISKSTQVKK